MSNNVSQNENSGPEDPCDGCYKPLDECYACDDGADKAAARHAEITVPHISAEEMRTGRRLLPSSDDIPENKTAIEVMVQNAVEDLIQEAKTDPTRPAAISTDEVLQEIAKTVRELNGEVARYKRASLFNAGVEMLKPVGEAPAGRIENVRSLATKVRALCTLYMDLLIQAVAGADMRPSCLLSDDVQEFIDCFGLEVTD